MTKGHWVFVHFRRIHKKGSGAGQWLWKRVWRKEKPRPAPRPKPTPKPSLPIQGCDYVSGPSTAQLKAAGIHFVCRYLSTPGNSKNLTLAEVKDLHAAGISIVLVFETTGKRALGGRAAGIQDALSARKQAIALGAPASVPIYFAVDFDTVGAAVTKATDYIGGAASVLGASRIGVYGGGRIVAACAKLRVCKWFWQTTAASSWGTPYSGRHIEQYANGHSIGGHSVDLDRALKTPYGAWAA